MASRKHVVTAALVAALAIGFVAGYWRSVRPRGFGIPRDSDQNILLITIDTLRADAMSSYGGPAQTPNLDRLASLGARFTFAHAHTVVTLPSHTSILSGLFPYNTACATTAGFA